MNACVVLFILVRVVFAQLCSECHCCAEGPANTCHNGYCNNGCIDGYYGDNCINRCTSPNCLKCDRYNSNFCSKCIAGYYLNYNYCIDCGTQCASCDTDGCQLCNDGYWGRTCDRSCAPNCKTCSKSNGYYNCKSCESGYYLYSGQCFICGTQCALCGSTGCQSCNYGYWGRTCESSCAGHCTSCQKSDGYCQSCEFGYYLYDWYCKNCGTHCALCGLSGCLSCNVGYWGSTCDAKCSQKCASCRKSNGDCLSCESGNYLNENSCYNCGTHCASCDSAGCQACDDGYWGSTCGRSCVQRCRESTCEQSNGNCVSCFPGYWGITCESPCDHHCLACNTINGECISCENGYWGHPCTACGAQCKTCDQSNGCSECNVGYYGKTCNKYSCNDCTECRKGYFMSDNYCKECKYKQNGCTCNNYSECSGCIEGYFLNSKFCVECLAPCTSCNSYYSCTSCTSGRFGQTCQHQCFEDCKNGICEEKNAICRCNSNYKGLKCDQCEDGKYGYFEKRCNITCPTLCNSCDQNGACTECKPGYSNQQNQCTCSKAFCVNQLYCESCTNISFYANGDVCCLCSLDNCVSCSKAFDTINCKICKEGYYPQSSGECERCNLYCFSSECDSSSGRCTQGCVNGYWNRTCDKECTPECLSCSQTDGSCTQCKNNTKYGPYCKMQCSTTCKDSVCDIDGVCSNGCVSHTFGKQCKKKCDAYCSPKGNKTSCSETTGKCLYGCQTGYKGTFCPKGIDTEAKKQASSTAALGGGVGGGVATLAVIVAVGLILLRRRKVKSSNKSHTPENLSALYATVNKGRGSRAEYANEDTDNAHSVTITENPNYQSQPTNSSYEEETTFLPEDNLEIDGDNAFARENTFMFETNEGIYYNNGKEVNKFKLTVANLPEYIQNICIKDLEEEFQNIPYGLVKPYEVSQTKLNMHKNRYKGIYPYDDTRVVVRGGDTDYINASYIDGFRKRNAYIATLGPTTKQLGDFGQFWRMVWQQKVEKIVMVTNLVEGEKTKCEKYWPHLGQSKIYGDIEVVCNVEKLYADFMWREFTYSKNSEERGLHHLQFTSWPDRDIPDDVTSIIEFRQRVNALPTTFDGPVIVHCSAGVGRTGTYIALDILTKEGEAEGAIDIPGCVLNMRQNRTSMIQTLNQYNYLHQALVHSLTLDCSLIKREHFHEYMEKSSKEELQKQFEKILLTHAQKSDKELQAMAKNRVLTKKNRKYADIPGDVKRPRLYLYLKPGESDYINAVYINSFKTNNRFLVTQSPLPDTVSDFLALAFQENCSCIVNMEAHLEKHAGIGSYIPADNQIMQKGVVSVRSTTEQSAIHFVKRMLHLQHEEKSKKDVTIPHYEYLDWDTKHNVPKSAEHFVDFIKVIEDVSQSSHPKGPILLHCLNAAGKTGLLCIVTTLLEQLTEDNEVSVVNAVQKVRARRPLAFPNKEQFYFCHECLLHFVNSPENAVYYNINGEFQIE